ncbi:MAG: DEAD/DEAH box helicase [Patescibacteria group bacterium]
MFKNKSANNKFGKKNYAGNFRSGGNNKKSFYYGSSDGDKNVSRSTSTGNSRPSFRSSSPTASGFASNTSGKTAFDGPKRVSRNAYGNPSAASGKLKTSYAGPNTERSTSFGENNRPSYGSRNSRPSYGDRNGRPSYGNSRPSFRSGSRSPRARFSENIDISKFICKPSGNVEVKAVEIKNSFADFRFVPELQTNLQHKKYITPTPIQDQSINHIVDGKDIIGLANTGTGKTGAFLLPLINKVFKNKSQKVLILAPTRELALQIDEEFRQFSWSMKIFSTVCVGGSPIFKQINNLKRNPNFVIGTPGRLKDLSERNLVRFESFNNIVIDEIDRMLDMGFVDEIKAILAKLPKERQSLFFSATMPEKIRGLIQQFLVDPVTVEIKSGQTADNVEQDVVRVRSSEMKFNQLQEILRQSDFKKVLIFSETKREVEKLTSSLVGEGFKADSIHGDKKQHQRQKALSLFKNDTVNILVATDVAARGLDIDDVSHVINYTVPQTYNDYIHRIGRTGRGDKKGMALTFV